MATNIVRKGLNQRWADIRKLSRSNDEFDRTSALAHSVACLEIGLAALGVLPERGRGVQSRLANASRRLGLRDLPTSSETKGAFAARNSAVHEHRVPSREACQKHITTFQKIWHSLRYQFVNREHATRLAESILETTGISHVFLFGSLALRSRGYSHDIDLLLFDDGEFSAFGAGYGGFELAMLEEHLGDLVNQYAVRCGWLDLSSSMGRDLAWMRNTQRALPGGTGTPCSLSTSPMDF